MATVAHELRSPLSAIYYANSLNRMASEQPTDQLDVIDRQVSYLNLLIEDLLDVSRVARDKIRLKKERIDAATIIDRAIERVRPLLAERKHELELDISSQAMPLNVDPVRVEQVLTNLLTNAAKYTPEGGKVWVTADRDGSSVHFRVRDNGIGISRDILPQIFDLFVQGDRARDQDEGGLGIGLALVRKICEMHGGSVRASSAGKNCGSEFLITLPLEKPAPLPLQVAL
jgi:signal transduction histidine kinase